MQRDIVRRKTASLGSVLAFGILLAAGTAGAEETWNGQPGVHHAACPGHSGTMVCREDGSVIMFSGNQALVSTDGGRTWGEPFGLKTTAGADISRGSEAGLRLKSGKIGLVTGTTGSQFFQTSEDGGKTFCEPVHVTAQGVRKPYYRCQITQLDSGRIVIPFYEFCGRRNYEMTWQRAPWSWSSMCYSYAVYSDDEGRTWHQSADDVIIVPAYWTKGHTETFTAFEEATVVQLKDGRVVMLGRNRMGRLFQSFSSDGGVHWSIAEPTALASSYAPAEIHRIPSTGDLVICWNQVSRQEIVDGLNRHRLSVALSVDEGKTWGNFKNLYSLDDYNYVRPDEPQIVVPDDRWIQWLKKNGGPGTIPGRGSVGTENVYVLPEDRSRYHRNPPSVRTCYPRMCVTGKDVLVSYDMSVPEKLPSVLDVFPIDWLYEPIVPAGPYAALYVDGVLVEGADVSLEDGEPFGWGDVMGRVMGVEVKRTRVPVYTFLKNYGGTVAEDGWQPNEGPKGTLRATKAK